MQSISLWTSPAFVYSKRELLDYQRSKFSKASSKMLEKLFLSQASATHLLGGLPTTRVVVFPFPFQAVGVDHTGPFSIKDIFIRGASILKSYVCFSSAEVPGQFT